ncbi:uncharacterized protein LOC106095106 [Stomoxys calcitrans]|uniref:uncharacterized protein LOC106095106 n=1 Tax=Stomoxys calcitrans TaxID=35570 RepID=UPI0027E3269F|nr:uncharacterized protein LOC106095106 [Stomoxys calcitrans]
MDCVMNQSSSSKNVVADVSFEGYLPNIVNSELLSFPLPQRTDKANLPFSPINYVNFDISEGDFALNNDEGSFSTSQSPPNGSEFNSHQLTPAEFKFATCQSPLSSNAVIQSPMSQSLPNIYSENQLEMANSSTGNDDSPTIISEVKLPENRSRQPTKKRIFKMRERRYIQPIDKVAAILRIRQGATKASISRAINVPESTIRGWCKNERKLRQLCGLEEASAMDVIANPYQDTVVTLPCDDNPSASISSTAAASLENDHPLIMEKIFSFNDTLQKLKDLNIGTSMHKLEAIHNPNSMIYTSSASILNAEYSQLAVAQNVYLSALLYPPKATKLSGVTQYVKKKRTLKKFLKKVTNKNQG